MNNGKSPNGKIANYTRGLIKWRWLVIVATLAFTFLAASGAQHLTFFSGYRIWFAPDNPQLQAFEQVENTYTKNDNVLFGLVPKNGQVFTTESIKAIGELTEKAWQIPYAIRVDGITNFQYSTAEEDDLWVRDLISDDIASDDVLLGETKSIALVQPALKNRLINEQTKMTGINVTLQLPADITEAIPEVARFVRELRDEIEAKYPGTEIYMTGMAMLNNAFAEVGTADTTTLIPLMYLLMLIIMFIALRSVTGTLTTLLVMTFSMAVAMGIGGWFGVQLTPMSLAAPTIIMTLAIADCIHIIMTVLTEYSNGRNKNEAIVESMRVNFLPVFLTSVTTSIGFLSLNFVKVPPINHLGNLTAVGVIAALLFSVFFLPALLSILPLRIRKKSFAQAGICKNFSDMVINNKSKALWGSIAVVVIMSSLIPLNELNDRFTEYFDETITFRTDNDYISDNLTSAYQIEFSLSAGESGAIAEPIYLSQVEKFVDWISKQEKITYVSSIIDVMKRLNMNMHGDDSAYYKIPDSRELGAQYLLLYEMSLPYGLDLNNQINIDKSSTRVSIVLDGATSARDIRNISAIAEAWLRDNTPKEMHSAASSPAVMFANISEIALINMLAGTTVALIFISGILMFALRTIKIGLYSLIPNLVPIAVGFGIWGIISGEINMGMAPVIGMTLGIVVDDTIHFLSKYLRGRREELMSSEDAIRYAFKTVGPALVSTTVILTAGFAVLATSAFRLNADMALMTAITITIALIADFILLPALLLHIDNKPAEEAYKINIIDKKQLATVS